MNPSNTEDMMKNKEICGTSKGTLLETTIENLIRKTSKRILSQNLTYHNSLRIWSVVLPIAKVKKLIFMPETTKQRKKSAIKNLPSIEKITMN